MTRRSIWYSIRGSLWFVPAVLIAFSFVLALGMVQVDAWLDSRAATRIPETLVAGPDGARQILSVIASSTITVAGVIFSITIVTLSLAAAQYSPRVLRSFMRDRLNQAVLGVLVSVFVYALLVLRAIRTGDDAFVPQVSLWLAILLVLVAIGFFIAFIHNTAMSIQAPEIVSRIANETLHALRAARRQSHEDKSADTEEALDPSQLRSMEWRAVASRESGYVQDVSINGLFQIACKHDVIIKVSCPVGEFAVEGLAVAQVSGCETLSEGLASAIQEQFGINTYRTVDQDPAFGVRQLVDIALKALSPSLNDTTTTIHCIDYLGVILHAALHEPAYPAVHKQDGKLRLVLRYRDSCDLIDLALHEIRQSAEGNVAVLLRLFRLLRQIREGSDSFAVRGVSQKHIDLISENTDRHVPSASDREVLKRAADRARTAAPGR